MKKLFFVGLVSLVSLRTFSATSKKALIHLDQFGYPTISDEVVKEKVFQANFRGLASVNEDLSEEVERRPCSENVESEAVKGYLAQSFGFINRNMQKMNDWQQFYLNLPSILKNVDLTNEKIETLKKIKMVNGDDEIRVVKLASQQARMKELLVFFNRYAILTKNGTYHDQNAILLEMNKLADEMAKFLNDPKSQELLKMINKGSRDSQKLNRWLARVEKSADYSFTGIKGVNGRIEYALSSSKKESSSFKNLAGNLHAFFKKSVRNTEVEAKAAVMTNGAVAEENAKDLDELFDIIIAKDRAEQAQRAIASVASKAEVLDENFERQLLMRTYFKAREFKINQDLLTKIKDQTAKNYAHKLLNMNQDEKFLRPLLMKQKNISKVERERILGNVHDVIMLERGNQKILNELRHTSMEKLLVALYPQEQNLEARLKLLAVKGKKIEGTYLIH